MNEYVIKIRETENDGIKVEIPDFHAAPESSNAELAAFMVGWMLMSMELNANADAADFKQAVINKIKVIKAVCDRPYVN
ncbi:hypothetical protein [Neisseria musculi]|uniref:Uncharacterized protein n=1 Tax=Neisseria musculi TaxID=1815583 RepID=A0A7H1M9B9_9NEIS|nr:hypothetical protein [Neisseria musculi]QNT58234.1 hypothetical protein H7A79_1135 [Neisseria musculi]